MIEEAVYERAQRHSQAMLATLAQVIISWNGLESKVRSVVERLISSPEELLQREIGRPSSKDPIRRAQIVTTNLPNPAVSNAIRVFSKLQRPELAGHLSHIAALFDKLKEYRNFYVHGMRAPGTYIHEDGSIKTTALAVMISARGSLTVSTRTFNQADLEDTLSRIYEAEQYIDSVVFGLLNHDIPPDKMSAMFTHLSALQKPRLPPQLLKNREFLLGDGD
jgi:hypothetical protein